MGRGEDDYFMKIRLLEPRFKQPVEIDLDPYRDIKDSSSGDFYFWDIVLLVLTFGLFSLSESRKNNVGEVSRLLDLGYEPESEVDKKIIEAMKKEKLYSKVDSNRSNITRLDFNIIRGVIILILLLMMSFSKS